MPPCSRRSLQLVVNGLMAGTMLAVPAIGFTAIYAVLRFPNFALASHATIGAFAGYVANVSVGPAGRAVAWWWPSWSRALRRRGDRRGRAQAVPSRRASSPPPSPRSRSRIALENVVRFVFGNELRGYDLPIAARLALRRRSRVGPQQVAEPRHRGRRHGRAVRLPRLHAHRQGHARGRRQSDARRHQGHQRRHGRRGS